VKEYEIVRDAAGSPYRIQALYNLAAAFSQLAQVAATRGDAEAAHQQREASRAQLELIIKEAPPSSLEWQEAHRRVQPARPAPAPAPVASQETPP
jgi:hypothetical protein